MSLDREAELFFLTRRRGRTWDAVKSKDPAAVADLLVELGLICGTGGLLAPQFARLRRAAALSTFLKSREAMNAFLTKYVVKVTTPGDGFEREISGALHGIASDIAQSQKVSEAKAEQEMRAKCDIPVPPPLPPPKPVVKRNPRQELLRELRERTFHYPKDLDL